MILRNNKVVDSSHQPYIVAEMNSSHNGNIEQAKAMIDAAVECGCDCVKFQSWTTESLYCQEYYEQNPISKRFVKKLSLSEDALLELSRYCDEKKIDFSSTPYSNAEVNFLVEKTNAPFIKIASMEINNIPYLKYIASKNVPIILSTGMSDYIEVRNAIDTILNAGNKELCVLHCVSVYPASADQINLRNMLKLREMFPDLAIGYSDHTIGTEVACAAVALGASVIEKHFTLNNKKIGMDNNMATEPEQMKDLVSACRNVFYSLGTYERKLSDKEIDMRSKMRRSIIARRDILKGEVLSPENIECKRPGTGISPNHIDEVIGKTALIDIKAGHLILHDQLNEQK
ncbi:MAG: N-acetylneuraminate synthase family protein [Lachnospiraceae bacterium]|nr:N-acetylneuraminate synthase family protein [Lachnospiraceae bacterium]